MSPASSNRATYSPHVTFYTIKLAHITIYKVQECSYIYSFRFVKQCRKFNLESL